MLSTFLVVLPVFALIFAGWAARRVGVLGPNATTELNRFVVYLALPALLFDIIGHTSGAELWQPGFIAVFGLSSIVIFAVTVALRLRRPALATDRSDAEYRLDRRHLADAAIDGLNAAYGNTGYVGFPLVLAALGPAAMLATTIATIITVCLVFAVAIVLIEISLQSERGRLRLIIKVIRSLAMNPLLVAPVLGAVIPLTGTTIPLPVENILKMLGGAASPCALVALGLFLAQRQSLSGRHLAGNLFLVGLKLIAQPFLAWLLARFVFGLSPLLTHTAVLVAALPTGTGPFMLAEFYRREAETTSNVILISTVLAILTISAYLAVAG